MPNFFFFFVFLINFSSSSHIPSRRILHEPFFPLDSIPPSEPPSPSPPTPKYPFSASSSTSTSTPNNSPFFPSFAAPPPPPSPASFASFPANISSLILPHSSKPKSSSHKLLIVAICSVISAAVVAGVLFFGYCRRRGRHPDFVTDDKTLPSETSNRVYLSNNTSGAGANNESRKQRATSGTSSEFLYLGTVVNSRSIEEGSDARRNARLDPRKMDSPELQPLPPLSRQNTGRNFREGEVGSVTETESEEFYSPRASLGGRESSSGTGSGSRRFANIASQRLEVKSSGSSTCSCTSSTSGSPERSHSASISPPISLSPRRSEPKSPESSMLPPQQPGGLSPEREVERNLEESPVRNVRSPPLSLASTSPETGFMKNYSNQTLRSPSLSPVSTSPNRAPAKNPFESLDLDRNIRSASVSSAAASPNRASVSNPDEVNDLIRNSSQNPGKYSSIFKDTPGKATSPSLTSAATSPDRFIVKNLDASDLRSSSQSSASTSPQRHLGDSQRISIALNRIVRSPTLSSASSSPIRAFEKIPDTSHTNFVPPDCEDDTSPLLSSASSSPARDLENSPPRKPISAPPPPPPPPPPQPPKVQRHVENPVPSTSIALQMSMPPPLVPPSRPFVMQNQNPVKVSVEMPQSSETTDLHDETPKPKLKPLHWDKVRASSDREMVWDHLRSSSFKLNEEMIETLFVVNTANSKPKETTPRSVLPSPNQENRVLDPKKAQNIAILLRALNVTMEEVCEALLEGNADTLGTELLESLLKMAPTKEEERKLQDYKDDSPVKLGPAEKFLKAVLDVPFAFKRVKAMLYIANFESEVEYLKRSFETLEGACEELRNSRMFLKLLEAVLKTGNRMNVGTNRGDAQAFKLDTLLKLVDVKGADGKTTLLHFVVQEIIRTEGARFSDINQSESSTLNEDAKCRKLGLQVVSGLCSELMNVKKAAAMDSDVLSSEVSKLSQGLGSIDEVLRLNDTMEVDESTKKFSDSMIKFKKMAEEEIIRIQAHDSVAMSLVKEITEYFHGNSAKEEAHPFRIFMVVRDFLTVLDRVCKEVGMINERTMVSSAHKFPIPVNPMMPPGALPGLQARRQYGSFYEENASP